MKKLLHFRNYIQGMKKDFFMILFILSSTLSISQTITPTKTVTVRPGNCGVIDVELNIEGKDPVNRPLEVILVIDVSGSMADPISGTTKTSMDYAKDAATDFINNVFLAANNPTGLNKVGIVSFSSTATLKQGLTLSSGKAGLLTIINGLSANGNTNLQDGIVKADNELSPPSLNGHGTYDCTTARSIVVLTDGVANRTGTTGISCSGSPTCSQTAITAANAAKTHTVSSVVYTNQIFTVGLLGSVAASDLSTVNTTLTAIQNSGYYSTTSAADLSAIYTNIFAKLSWVAKELVIKENVAPGFGISIPSSSSPTNPTKGTTSVAGQVITWNVDFLNPETISLKYTLTPSSGICGSNKVSTSRLDYKNSTCASAFLDINTPDVMIPCPTVTLVSQTDVKCYGSKTGEINITAAGGVAPYTYAWTGTGVNPTAEDQTGLGAGIYKVIIKDANGCASSELSVTIMQPSTALVAAIGAVVNINCKGDATGSATASATGGTPDYTYSWNTNPVQTNATATGLAAGTYTVTVTDSKQCTDTEQITITEPQNALVAAIGSVVNVNCKGDVTGSATASATGGTPDYTYSWNTNPVQTNATATGLAAGTYTVTVTDSKQCTDTEEITITEPQNPLVAAIGSVVNVNCKGDATGSATASATGGTPDYTYSWNTNPVQTNATATGLAVGTYIVTVTDSKQCTDTEEITITEPLAPLSATGIVANNNNCVGCSNGSIDLTVSGGTAPYTFEWSNGATSEDISNLPNGTYSVEITDSKGCKANYTFIISESSINIAKDGTYVDSNQDGITNVGDMVTYSFVVKNTGSVVLTNITVTDNNAVITGGPIATLAPGATDSTTFSGSHVITQEDINTGYVYNLATVTGTDPEEKPVTDTSSDPTPCSTCPIDPQCPDCTITPLTQSPGIVLVKTNNIEVGQNECSTLAVGDVVTYTFTVTNPGNVSLHNITVIDPHTGLSAIALESGDSNTNNILEVTETWIYKATYAVTQADIDNGTITNQASVNGTSPNNTIVTDQSGNVLTDNNPNIITFCINPGLTVVKTATTASFSVVGDVINYTITVKNTGNVTLHQIAVKDPLTGLDTIIDVLAAGATSEYTQSYTVTQEDLNKGSVTNVATADGLTPKDTPISATDDEIVNEKANVINAVDDNAGPIDGINGATNILNVFNNDTLNAVAVNPADVTLTLITPDATGYMTMNPDGSIDIKDGTPAGTYTLVYQICENANSTNCDSATVTINVICNNTTKMAGVVFNAATNAPIANVPVTLIPQGTTTGPILIRITNAQGYYNFTGMVPGDYLVQVQDANLNSAYQLYPTNSSLFFTTLENCVYQFHDFGYDKSDLPVLGDFVWYDLNGNGLQDEWFDANNDGLVTQNIPDANGSFDYSKWEWIDLNGDGSYKGPLNVGELNAAGFGNAKSPNIFVTGPNDYSSSVIVGIEGFWRNRPPVGAFGDYKVELKMDANLEAQSSAMGATGLVKVLPATGKNGNSTKTSKPASFEVCGPTNQNPQTANLTTDNQVNLDIDFGINCKMFADIQATPDVFSVTQCSFGDAVRNALSNDLLNGSPANISDFKFKLLSALGQNIKIDDNGNVTFVNGVAAGQYTFDYQVCEAANPTNCATSTITINVAAIAPVTITGPAVCNADTTPVDLSKFLPQGTATDGTWIDTDSTGGLSGNILNTIGIPVNTYHFEYKIAGDCPRSILLETVINDDCKVLPCKSIIVHNAFSSNEDGRNDYFQIENIENNDCYKNVKVEVFNRWGILVFEKDNYNNGSNAFRGKSEGRTTINKNEGLPTGTYFYILSYDTVDGLGNAQNVKKDGYIYLIK
jgi:gliding motility-associated-like protein/uncharacterized repeat protein (TIGR01451 family)